jgi:hypothetical protein
MKNDPGNRRGDRHHKNDRGAHPDRCVDLGRHTKERTKRDKSDQQNIIDQERRKKYTE